MIRKNKKKIITKKTKVKNRNKNTFFRNSYIITKK